MTHQPWSLELTSNSTTVYSESDILQVHWQYQVPVAAMGGKFQPSETIGFKLMLIKFAPEKTNGHESVPTRVFFDWIGAVLWAPVVHRIT